MRIFFFIFLKRKLCSTHINHDVLVVMKKIFYLPLFFFFVSCWDWKNRPIPEPPPPVKVLGYVPIYSQDPTIYNIYADTPRAVKNAGKIYVKGNLIFQNDYGYGIHIFDKTIPTSPKKIGFINMRGNLEMSIKGNLLYANSYADLVVVDISDWNNLKEVQRIKDAFYKGYEAATMTYVFVPPPARGVYFECPDFRKGILTGWKQDSIYNNTCFYSLTFRKKILCISGIGSFSEYFSS